MTHIYLVKIHFSARICFGAATEAGTGVVVLTNADNVHDAFCAGGASAVEQALFTLAKTL